MSDTKTKSIGEMKKPEEKTRKNHGNKRRTRREYCHGSQRKSQKGVGVVSKNKCS